jgi:hypothetical protein
MPRSVLIGRRRLFPEDAVEAWLQAQEARQTIPSGEAQATPPDPSKPVGRPRCPSNVSALNRESRRRKPQNSKHRAHSPAQIGLFGKE